MAQSEELSELQSRIKNSLWGLFISDALSMPVHWYYNRENIRTDFGKDGISKYEDAKHPHPEAFMIDTPYKPNLERATQLNRNVDIIPAEFRKFYDTNLPQTEKVEIDDASIDKQHGNRVAAAKERYHYHHGLKAGGNTLGAHLSRLLLRNVVKQMQSNGVYMDRSFAADFVDYMTNKDNVRTDRDAYTEKFLRRYFEHYSNGKDILNCGHRQQDDWSIGSHGGVIRPLILSALFAENTFKSMGIAMQHAAITHRSETVNSALAYLIPIFLNVINGKSTLKDEVAANANKLHLPVISGKALREAYQRAKGPQNIEKTAMYKYHTEYEKQPFDAVEFEKEHKEDEVVRNRLSTACYAEHGIPLILYILLHCDFAFEKSLLFNANCGGDNVHRGMILGLLLGAMVGNDENDPNYKELERLKKGLVDYQQLQQEIDAFADCVCSKLNASKQ